MCDLVGGGVAMNHRPCKEIQACFSAYLDGAVSGQEMLGISRHIEGQGDAAGCEACAREFAAWRQTQSAVSALRPVKAPGNLALQLRLAISHERARRESRLLDRLSLAWDNALRPALLQVSAGLAGSVVLLGTILTLMVVGAPTAVLANDEPLGAVTAPHYKYSMVSPEAIVTPHDSPIVVEAAVDTVGRVYDYTIVEGPQDDAVRAQVATQLLGSVFEPASAFGVPIRGRVILTFAGISVRG